MEIEARMRLVNYNALIAVGDVTIDNMITLHEVKVVMLNEKTIISLPRKQTASGWKNVVSFMSPELRKTIEEKVLEAVWAETRKPLPRAEWEISVKPYQGDKGLKGYATISYPGMMEITGIQIVEREGRNQIVYPYGFSGRQIISLAGPANINSKDYLETEILTQYQREAEKQILPTHSR